MQMREVSINNWENMELHPLCSLFPEMGEKDFDSLLESMKSNGFLSTDPIVVVFDDEEDEWLVLDGQNRKIAARQTNVTPTFVQFKGEDRKSTRLNSSHRCISYAVFCLKKKNEIPR